MLGFMQKNVILVFTQVLLMALGTPLAAHAEAAFQATSATGAKVSGHLDFSIMIQPSLFLRIGVKAAQAVSQSATEAPTRPVPTTETHGTRRENDEGTQGSSAPRITIYGNNGSIHLSSATTRPASDGSHPLTGKDENRYQTAITLAARRKIVNVERNWQHEHFGALSLLSKADGGKSAYRGADRIVYTAAQL
jgi:hypothetical protein